LQHQSFYVIGANSGKSEDGSGTGFNDLPMQTQQSTTIFVFTNLIYIISCISFQIGEPFRKGWWTNPFFVLNVLILFVYSVIIAFIDASRFPGFYFYTNNNPAYVMPNSWLEKVCAYSMIWCVLVLIWEKLVCTYLV
jgi:magnesium-transporting ATPase (P-type)